MDHGGEFDMEDQIVRRHKGLGIASFVIALICLVLILMLFGIAGAMTNAGKATPEFNTIIGFGLFFAWFVDVVGVALGIAGALDRSSKKVFPVLGLVFGIGILVLSVALVVVGISMAAR
jgi:hypothetical protein